MENDKNKLIAKLQGVKIVCEYCKHCDEGWFKHCNLKMKSMGDALKLHPLHNYETDTCKDWKYYE